MLIDKVYYKGDGNFKIDVSFFKKLDKINRKYIYALRMAESVEIQMVNFNPIVDMFYKADYDVIWEHIGCC